MKPLIWIDDERHNVQTMFVITWVEKYSKIKTSLKMFLQAENKYHSIKVEKKKQEKNQDNLWNITWWLDHFCSYYFFWSNTKYNVPLFDLRDINVLCIFPQVFIYQPKFKQKSNLLRQRWVVYALTLTKTSMKRTQYWNLQKQS